MSTLTYDDLPPHMAAELTRVGADLDNEAACAGALIVNPDFLEREILACLDEAMAIAEMADWCKRDLARLRQDIDAERKR